MLYHILHISEYTYSDQVFFEPHQLRFKPKSSPHISVKDFNLTIEPEPAGFSEHTDIENNHTVLCWFEQTHQKLTITSQVQVEISPYNPFNFLVYPTEYLQIPFEYEKRDKQLLKTALDTFGLEPPLQNYTKKILQESNYHSVNFITNLTKDIAKNISLQSRETGEPLQPDITFKQKVGSCRDITWMQIHILRQLGIASRFVSGYFFVDSDEPEFELHAWLEAYLPGAGWIGFDPSHGILTDCFHIPVASSAFYQHTMPVSGSVRGSTSSQLSHQLHITQKDQ